MKFDNYYVAYKEQFKKYETLKLRLLEIGVQSGSSLAYWKENYPFDVWGADIDPKCAGHQVIIGDQSKVEFLESLPLFNIIIDDGGHTMQQQQITFQTLFPKLPSGGIYVIEDLHTSFWPKFWDISTKTTDYAKDLTDTLHEEANNITRLEGQRMARNQFGIASVHFYPSLVFIHKK